MLSEVNVIKNLTNSLFPHTDKQPDETTAMSLIKRFWANLMKPVKKKIQVIFHIKIKSYIYI